LFFFNFPMLCQILWLHNTEYMLTVKCGLGRKLKELDMIYFKFCSSLN